MVTVEIYLGQAWGLGLLTKATPEKLTFHSPHLYKLREACWGCHQLYVYRSRYYSKFLKHRDWKKQHIAKFSLGGIFTFLYNYSNIFLPFLIKDYSPQGRE